MLGVIIVAGGALVLSVCGCALLGSPPCRPLAFRRD